MLRLIALAGALAPLTAAAHHTTGSGPGGAEIVLDVLLAASAILYAHGVRSLWRRAGAGRGITRLQVTRFAAGWVVLALALVSPIDTWGETSFAAHMVQHELLMVVAAPLLVLGRPLEAWAWAFPMDVKHGFARIARLPALRAAWNAATEPLGAFSLHAIALWTWHLPVLFGAALADQGVHVLQHASFLASALVFWWSVFDRERARSAAPLASLFATMLHTSALGALLTFAPTVWYDAYAAGAGGLSALEDQQLGGLVMWVPAGFAYVAAALWIASRWLGRPSAGARAYPR